MANSALKMVHASSAKAVPIEADRKPSEDASSVSASDSTEPLSLPNRILEEPKTPANETDLGIWWDSDSDSEPSFGQAVSEVLSRFCWVFCCPPCPPCITRKIAFHPPRPATYKVNICGRGIAEMEIVDEALKISSPFQMKGEVVLLYEKPKLCKTRLKRIVAMQWLHPALPSKTNMLILHSHVNAADLGSLHLAMEILARRTGCDVVAYDYAGYGGSDGTPGENIILQNADTVMRYVIEVLQRPTTKVIVYGQSIGSVPTWYLASKYEVAGVIQLSGLHSGWRTLCRNRKSSAPFGCCCLNPFNNAAWIKNIRAPVLLIHGTEDEVIQFSQALEMRRLCGRLAVEPLWAEGLGHMGIERTRVFYQRISRFINEEVRHFKNTSPTASMLSSDSSFSLLSLHQPSQQQQQQTMQKADTNPAPIPSLFLRQSALPTATTSADRTAAAVIRTSAKLKGAATKANVSEKAQAPLGPTKGSLSSPDICIASKNKVFVLEQPI